MVGSNRKVSRGHEFLRGRPKGVYYPDAVGIVQGYPKTEETWLARQKLMRENIVKYNAAGISTRKGVPDGWAGRKAEAAAASEAAHNMAKLVMEKMVEKELVPVPIPDSMEAKGQAAIVFAIGVVLDPTVHFRERLQAAKLVSEYTLVKPAAKSEITVSKAEDFLTALLED